MMIHYVAVPKSLITYLRFHTLRSDYQGLTLTPLLTPTLNTMYCDVVLIVCNETSQFMLCDTGNGDVQKSAIWDLGSIGSDADEVEISTVSTMHSVPSLHAVTLLTSSKKLTQNRVGTDGRPVEIETLHNMDSIIFQGMVLPNISTTLQ